MNYVSTRDKKLKISASRAILTGLSRDGGLFVPSEFPRLTERETDKLLKMTYNGRAKLILGKFLTDFTQEQLESCVEAAYTGKFEGGNPAPTVKLGEGAFVCELWHGPTCAFKDMALSILPRLMKTAAKIENQKEKVVILTATSGDTGKAALEGFKDVVGTSIIVFYPSSGVSEMQRLQMVTQEGGNVFVFGVDGNFDAAQTGVKRIFSDAALRDEFLDNGYVFSSANSINFGRLVPQIVYYWSSYLDMVSAGEIKLGEKINFCVPTGNFGNILAAYYARRMGLPVNKLICASNRNNVLTDFFDTGVYDKNRPFYLTSSPSMDILVSSNLERLLFELSGRDDGVVSSMMEDLSGSGGYRITDDMKNELSEVFDGGCLDDEGTAKAIGEAYRRFGYVFDTHTAVAFGVWENYKAKTGDQTKTVIVSTASPFKFCKDVLLALGDEAARKDGVKELSLLSRLSEYGMPIPAPLAGLSEKEIRFKGTYKVEEMAALVKKSAGI